MKKSIIFDIDGTLLYARGIGRQAFGVAFKTAYGVEYPAVDQLCFVGATDSTLIRDMAKERGVESTIAREEHFFLVLTKIIDEELARNKPLVCDGVPELLTELRESGFSLGIITGNIRATAWSKLRHAALDRHFMFGAYGNDHHKREEITGIAISRAPDNCPITMMIGDTPLDIHAAKMNNLKAIAVATGWVSAAELVEAGADLVLDSFADTERALAQILELGDSRSAHGAEVGRASNSEMLDVGCRMSDVGCGKK